MKYFSNCQHKEVLLIEKPDAAFEHMQSASLPVCEGYFGDH